MANKWIPNYIKRNINYYPRDILSAQEFNAILNLLITQGDYNSAWIEYLQNDAIPEAVREIGIEEIQDVLSNIVREEIAALAASVVNKTSAQLNNPMVSILNTGLLNTGVTALNTLLESKNFVATYAVATNLIGSSSSYPSLTELNTLKSSGNDIVAYSTDGSTVTPETVNTVAAASKQFVTTNDFNTDVFVYPNGNSDDTVRDAVCDIYDYAVNISTAGAIIPDGILANSDASILGNLAVVKLDDTVNVAAIESIIDDVVQHNKYLILWINTDSANYDSTVLSTVLDYLLTKSSVVYPESISDAMHAIHETIDNTLAALTTALDGMYITEINNEKYLNW